MNKYMEMKLQLWIEMNLEMKPITLVGMNDGNEPEMNRRNEQEMNQDLAVEMNPEMNQDLAVEMNPEMNDEKNRRNEPKGE
jgi:hypothetical protein